MTGRKTTAKSARRRRTVEEWTEREPTQPDDAAAGELNVIDEMLQRDTLVKIYRDESGEWAFVEQLAAADFSEDGLAKYGAGTYRVRLWEPIEGNPRKRKQSAQYTFRISGAVAERAKASEAPSDPGAMADRMMAAGLMQMLQSMQQNSQATAQVIASMVQTQTAVMQAMADTRKDSPLLDQLVQQALKPRDELALLERAAKVLQSATAPAVPDVFEQFARFEEMRERFAPKSAAEASWVSDLVKLAGPILAQHQAAVAQPAPAASAGGDPVEPYEPEPESEPMHALLPGGLSVLAPALPAIVADCDAGLRPESSARYHVERAPKWARDVIRSALADSGALDYLLRASPELAARGEWLAGFVAAVRVELGGVADGSIGSGEPDSGSVGSV